MTTTTRRTVLTRGAGSIAAGDLRCRLRLQGDLKGFKIRLPVAPLFIALQTGLVDGQENPLIPIDTAKLYEVQKYCSIINHIWVGLHVSFNNAAWKRLPRDVQAIAYKEFAAGAMAERDDWQTMNKTEVDKLTKSGLTFKTPGTKPFREALRKSGFCPDMKKEMGDEAWGLLEKYSKSASVAPPGVAPLGVTTAELRGGIARRRCG